MNKHPKMKFSLPLLAITAFLTALVLLSPPTSAKNEPADDAGEIAAAASPLSGVVVVIDPGHGGYDCGAVGRFTKVLEKDINLQVAQKVQELLSGSGAAVIMTRETDTELCSEWTPNGSKKQEDMARRAAIINEADADIVLSIHMNEYTFSKYFGAQVFYLQDAPQDNDEGKKLATHIQNTLVSGIDNGNTRREKAGDYYILRVKPASVLIECGFLSNENEEKLLCDDEYQSKLAWCIYAGLTDYLTAAHQIGQAE